MVPIYEARTMRASPGTEINTVFSVINTKENVLRVIRLDLKFHITNCYEKLIAGVEILIREIDIGPRTPTRRTTPDLSLVEYKFTRRIAEEKVMTAWKY